MDIPGYDTWKGASDLDDAVDWNEIAALDIEADRDRHYQGLEDGSVTIVGDVYRPFGGGMTNIGGRSTQPAYAVETSDGWEEQFRTEAEALAFVARYRREAAE